MSEERKVAGLWSFLRVVLLKPSWELLTTGAVFTLLSVLTWWRDNFASDDWKSRLELKGILPHWHPAWWICIWLIVIIIQIMSESYRLWQKEHEGLEKLLNTLPDSAPELEVFIARGENKRFSEAITLRNVSRDNIQDFQVLLFRISHLVIGWKPMFSGILEARREISLLPFIAFIEDGFEIRKFEGLSALLAEAIKVVGKERENMEIGEIRIRCRDRRNICYEMFAPVRYSGFEQSVHIGYLERRIINRDEPDNLKYYPRLG